MIRLSPWKRAAVLLSAAALLAGCGSSPTDTPAAVDPDAAASSLDSVYAAIEGLSGQARHDKLLELAKAEESENGPMQVYHFGDFPDEIAAFTEETGLQVEPFASTGERVAERVRNEFRAGQIGSSVMMTNAETISTLQEEGAVADLVSPIVEETVPQEFRNEFWVSVLGIMLMPSYNTDLVSPDQVPTSWEDYFTNYAGTSAIELTGWEWMGTLVTRYFVEKKGMTEEAAIQMMTEGLRGAFVVDGNTLMANLLASGQYGFLPSAYAHHIARLQGEGAPISYEGIPSDMLPILTSTGISLTAGGPNPATGLLFVEHMIGERAQTIIADRDYVPSSTSYQGETLLDRFPDAIPMGIARESGETYEQAQEKWTAIFDTLVRSTGGELLEE